jgi:hypothetical protein
MKSKERLRHTSFNSPHTLQPGQVWSTSEKPKSMILKRQDHLFCNTFWGSRSLCSTPSESDRPSSERTSARPPNHSYSPKRRGTIHPPMRFSLLYASFSLLSWRMSSALSFFGTAANLITICDFQTLRTNPRQCRCQDVRPGGTASWHGEDGACR